MVPTELEGPEVIQNCGLLELVAPDCSDLGDPLGLSLPFVMWTIGDQPLIDHWLDHALDQGFEQVVIYASDRPHRLREHYAKKADFWPIGVAIKTLRADSEAPPHASKMWCLPNEAHTPNTICASKNEILTHWQELERTWLDAVLASDQENSRYMALGSGCQVHPTAKINMPACIGDNVSVGPGCEIGPYAVVESGVVLAGGNCIRNSHITQDTYLGPDTELDGAVLVGRRLLNLRLKAEVSLVDSFIADTLSSKETADTVSVSERLEAICVCLLLKLFENKYSKKAPFLCDRSDALKKVIRGELALYGKRALREEDLNVIDDEIRSALEAYPDGFYSFADAQGVHEPSDPATFLHLVYASSLPYSFRVSTCRRALWKLLLK